LADGKEGKVTDMTRQRDIMNERKKNPDVMFHFFFFLKPFY
jgi:hypothetical protein